MNFAKKISWLSILCLLLIWGVMGFLMHLVSTTPPAKVEQPVVFGLYVLMLFGSLGIFAASVSYTSIDDLPKSSSYERYSVLGTIIAGICAILLMGQESSAYLLGPLVTFIINAIGLISFTVGVYGLYCWTTKLRCPKDMVVRVMDKYYLPGERLSFYPFLKNKYEKIRREQVFSIMSITAPSQVNKRAIPLIIQTSCTIDFSKIKKESLQKIFDLNVFRTKTSDWLRELYESAVKIRLLDSLLTEPLPAAETNICGLPISWSGKGEIKTDFIKED